MPHGARLPGHGRRREREGEREGNTRIGTPIHTHTHVHRRTGLGQPCSLWFVIVPRGVETVWLQARSLSPFPYLYAGAAAFLVACMRAPSDFEGSRVRAGDGRNLLFHRTCLLGKSSREAGGLAS